MLVKTRFERLARYGTVGFALMMGGYLAVILVILAVILGTEGRDWILGWLPRR